MTVPNSAKFTTADCLNTPEPQATEETLKERAAKFLLDQILSNPKAPGFWTDFHDEVTTLLADFACTVALPIVRERVELMAALKAIVRIRTKGLCIRLKEENGQEHYAESCIWCKADAAILKAGGQ